MGTTDDPRHESLTSPPSCVYPFSTAELARLAHYHVAIQAGFYNDAVSQVPGSASGHTAGLVLRGMPGSPIVPGVPAPDLV
jgi:hypothetical protein